MTEVLRSPEERFRDLPDFPYSPHYLDDLKAYDVAEAGHFVQERGEDVALNSFHPFPLFFSHASSPFSSSLNVSVILHRSSNTRCFFSPAFLPQSLSSGIVSFQGILSI